MASRARPHRRRRKTRIGSAVDVRYVCIGVDVGALVRGVIRVLFQQLVESSSTLRKVWWGIGVHIGSCGVVIGEGVWRASKLREMRVVESGRVWVVVGDGDSTSGGCMYTVADASAVLLCYSKVVRWFTYRPLVDPA